MMAGVSELNVAQCVSKITASSEYDKQYVSNLIDGESDSCWGSSETSPPHWVRIEMVAGVSITSLSVLVPERDSSYIPCTVHVMGGYSLVSEMNRVATMDISLDQLQLNDKPWVKLLDHVSTNTPDGHWSYPVWEIRVMKSHSRNKGCELYGLKFTGHYTLLHQDSAIKYLTETVKTLDTEIKSISNVFRTKLGDVIDITDTKMKELTETVSSQINHLQTVFSEGRWNKLLEKMEEINIRQKIVEDTYRMHAGSFAKLERQRHSKDDKISALCDVVIARGDSEVPIKAHSNVLCTRAGRFMTLMETVRARDNYSVKFTIDDFYPFMECTSMDSVDAQSDSDPSADSDTCSKKKVEYPSNDTLTEVPPAYTDIDNFFRRPPSYPGNDSDIDRAAAVQYVIDFCYNKEPPLTMHNVGNIYKVSDKIGVSDLKRACADLVITSINPQNWVEHYHTALGLNNVDDLVEKIKEYAKDHPKDCLQCPDVVYLSLHSFYFIFHETEDDLENLQNLSDEDEIVLYEAIIQWLRSESLNEIVRERREERLLNAGKLMSLVKFKYIAEEYLWEQIQNEPILAANPGVVREMKKVLPRQRQGKSTNPKM